MLIFRVFKSKAGCSSPSNQLLKAFLLSVLLIPINAFSQVIKKVTNGATSIDFSMSAGETGTLYYVLYSSSPNSPSTNSILSDSQSALGGNIIKNGTIVINNGQKNQTLTRLITNLADNRSYYLFAFYQGASAAGPIENITVNLATRHLATSYISQVSGQVGYKIRYWIYRPESYYKNPGNYYPLLMFYHGLGEMGTTDADIGRVLANGPPKMISQGQEMEYIVVSPQAYNDASGPVRYATPGWLDEVLEVVKSQNRVDINRVYLTGLSLGGRACYILAANQPSKIAALLPASGVFDNVSDGQVCGMKDIPFWGFNNDNDPVVNYGWNLRRFIGTVNNCSPGPVVAPLTTIYSANYHDSWTNMYNTEDVYPWLLSKTKNQPTNKVISVNAGGTISVSSTSFTLNGTASSPNGSIVYYEWTKRGGNDLTMINPNSANAVLQDLKQGSYNLRLLVTDNMGASSFADVTLNVNPTNNDTQAPSVPQNLSSSSQSTNNIVLNWNSSTDNVGVTGYNIYNAQTLSGTVSGNVNSYSVTGLNASTNYSFSVKAFDAAGNLSGLSNVLPVSTKTATINTGSGTGLTARYFTNSLKDFTVPLTLTRTDATVNFNWGFGSPDQTISNDHFTAQWSGQILPSYSEEHTFYTNTDDGVRLWVNGQLIIDQWVDQGAKEWLGKITLTAGQKYDIKLQYYENAVNASCSLSWSSSSISKQIIPMAQLYPDTSLITKISGSGLTARYFTNSLKDFTVPLTLTRTEATVNFNWGNGSPDQSVSNDHFVAQWTGKILANYSEENTFYTNTDDGVRLWVNGQLIIDQWVDQAAKEWLGKITLIAGQKYDIKLQYYENTANASCSLSWSSSSQSKQVIPTAQLFPEGSVATNSPVTITPPTAAGLTARYYTNSIKDFTVPLTLTRTEATVDFNWSSGSPDQSISNDHFVAQWTGQILANYSEEYTFYTNTDDGARLWVNGQLLIDQWVDEQATEWSGKITLTAGQKYDIKLQYYENTANASCSLLWSSLSQTKQVVPTAQLFPESGAVVRYSTVVNKKVAVKSTEKEALTESNNNVTLFPVPTDEILNIKLSSKVVQKADIQIYNSLGNLVLQKMESVSEGENAFGLNVHHLIGGVYIIKIGLKDQTVSKRFIKL